MIWALLIGLLVSVFITLGDSATPRLDAVRDRIEAAGLDESRQERAGEALDGVEVALVGAQEGFQQAADELAATLRDQQATEEQLLAALAKLEALEGPLQEEILLGRAELKRALTREEWARVFAAEPPASGR